MARGRAVQVMGIWLRRDGNDVVVSAEDLGGHDVELIRERIDGQFSHNISEHGIRDRFSEDFWRRANAFTSSARSHGTNDQTP